MDVENLNNLEDAFDPPVSDTPMQGEPTPSQPQAAEPAAVSSLPQSLLSRAQAAGLPLDGIDNSDQLAEFAIQRYLEDRAYAEYGRSNLASQPRAQAHPQREEAQAQGKQTDEFDVDGHFSGLWKEASLNEEAKFAIQHGIVVLGEDDLYQAKPGYESLALPILNGLNQAHTSQREQLQGFFNQNPYKAMYEALLPALRNEFGRQAQEVAQQQLTNYQQENFVEKFKSDNTSWLYHQDGRLTSDGQRFADTVAELREQGIKDPQILANYALKITGINTHAGAQPTGTVNPGAATPAPSNGKQRDDQGRFLPAGTPAPVAPPPPTKQESFIDKARRQAALSNSNSGGIANNPDYQVANDGELENMFTTAWKQQSAAA